MASIQARLIHRIIRIVNLKKQTTKGVFHPPKRTFQSAILTKRIIGNGDFETIEIGGRKIGIYTPENANEDQTLLYFHGGHYVNEAHPLMHRFARNLANKSKCKICLMDYPLAPEDTYEETHKWSLEAYNALLGKVGGELILCGDSAGGGLALALAQRLNELQHPTPPKKLMLFSPWLDLEFQIPLTDEDEKKCLILHPDTMHKAAQMYGGDENRANYLLSPINGELSNIGKIALWVGTEECAYKPSVALLEKARKYKVYIEFHSCSGMHHDFFLLPIPETKKAIAEMANFINAG
ncbi:MAG: monoterpene epsilon-lactone hydrolase [Saprospiraceae bacterium]|jgi:monoterpene epsilon-lactone hydrolase